MTVCEKSAVKRLQRSSGMFDAQPTTVYLASPSDPPRNSKFGFFSEHHCIYFLTSFVDNCHRRDETWPDKSTKDSTTVLTVWQSTWALPRTLVTAAWPCDYMIYTHTPFFVVEWAAHSLSICTLLCMLYGKLFHLLNRTLAFKMGTDLDSQAVPIKWWWLYWQVYGSEFWTMYNWPFSDLEHFYYTWFVPSYSETISFGVVVKSTNRAFRKHILYIPLLIFVHHTGLQMQKNDKKWCFYTFSFFRNRPVNFQATLLILSNYSVNLVCLGPVSLTNWRS